MTAALLTVMRYLFPDCRSAEASRFRREFRAVEKRLGPFDAVALHYAAGTVVFGIEFQTATAAVQRAQDARTNGKGRRPTAAAVERLKRRQGLSWQSYDSAMRRLEELTRTNKRGGLASYLAGRAKQQGGVA